MDLGWIQLSIVIGGVVFTAGGAWTALYLKVRTLKAKIEELEGKLADEEEAEDARKTHYEDADRHLEDQINGLLQRLAAAETLLASKTTELETLRQELATNQQSAVDAHKRINALGNQLSGLQLEASNIKRDLEVLRTGIATRLDFLARSEGVVSDLVAKHAQAQTSLKRAEEDIQRLETSRGALEQRVAKLEGAYIRRQPPGDR